MCYFIPRFNQAQPVSLKTHFFALVPRQILSNEDVRHAYRESAARLRRLSPLFYERSRPCRSGEGGAFTLGGQTGFPGLPSMPEARRHLPGLYLIDGVAARTCVRACVCV